MSVAVFAFECRIHRMPEYGVSIINERTAARAKSRAWDSASDANDTIRFTDMRVRKLGAPVSSAHFLHTAAYRGLPFLRCGMRVITEGIEGVIVDSGGGANFGVLADRNGVVYYCHPDYFKSLDGVPIAEVLAKWQAAHSRDQASDLIQMRDGCAP